MNILWLITSWNKNCLSFPFGDLSSPVMLQYLLDDYLPGFQLPMTNKTAGIWKLDSSSSMIRTCIPYGNGMLASEPGMIALRIADGLIYALGDDRTQFIAVCHMDRPEISCEEAVRLYLIWDINRKWLSLLFFCDTEVTEPCYNICLTTTSQALSFLRPSRLPVSGSLILHIPWLYLTTLMLSAYYLSNQEW